MKIGQPYIIAELGANHNGDMAIARKLIDAAKQAGCDCVKFQSWTKHSLFSKKVYVTGASNLKKDGAAEGPSLEQLLDRYSTSRDQLREMAVYSRQAGIDFACSPFSDQEADFLARELDVPFIKIASMDVNHPSFLDHVARLGKPVLLSTGLSTIQEIARAVDALERGGAREITLLHCVSIYPTPDDRVNLNNLDMLRERFPGRRIGYSDHTLGTEVALAAVAKGAAVIEKHFTLDRGMEGWDHAVSATPDQMKAIVDGARRITRALGSYERVLSEEEKKNIPLYRRSLVAARQIEKGAVIGPEDLTAKRPGDGLAPDQIGSVLGRRAKRTIPADEPLTREDF